MYRSLVKTVGAALVGLLGYTGCIDTDISIVDASKSKKVPSCISVVVDRLESEGSCEYMDFNSVKGDACVQQLSKHRVGDIVFDNFLIGYVKGVDGNKMVSVTGLENAWGGLEVFAAYDGIEDFAFDGVADLGAYVFLNKDEVANPASVDSSRFEKKVADDRIKEFYLNSIESLCKD